MMPHYRVIDNDVYADAIDGDYDDYDYNYCEKDEDVDNDDDDDVGDSSLVVKM